MVTLTHQCLCFIRPQVRLLEFLDLILQMSLQLVVNVDPRVMMIFEVDILC